ncbi:MAG: hypothetical protein HYY52_08555 [Candidatus Melainabacteria bacterium]|nr:hypothetical protein [Candidatus Melainabacteria bacterium]
MVRARFIFIILLLFFFFTKSQLAQAAFLSYDDLTELSKTLKPAGLLKEKLEKQLTTPVIQQPLNLQTSFLTDLRFGEFFRVASWNIERGFNVDRIIQIPEYSLDYKTNPELLEQLKDFLEASVIVLNEVDIGLPRTKYENIVKKIADAFKMGYAFGTEFIEVDPYQLGLKKFTKEERVYLEEETLKQLDNIEKDKFLGLHGTAILSKYPILNAKIIRLPDCYNWYVEESNKLSALEHLRRGTAEKIFSEKVLTELRHGGRMALAVDLLLPNGQKITIVGTHLENRCIPSCRYIQFDFLLKRLRNVKNPLILAGDLNTTGTDTSPVSIKKEVLKRVKDPEYVATQAILSLTPITFIQNLVLDTANAFRHFKDPTTKNIPLLLPNKERKLFDLLKEFRFNDSGAFDIRGIANKTYTGFSGFLSNSNERELKGFKPTFELQRHFGIAKYKLDWIFVKPLNLTNPNDKQGSYAYAPHFGRTLQTINQAFGKLSDHDPIVVDISTGEPVSPTLLPSQSYFP